MTIKPIEILTPNILEAASLSDAQGEVFAIKHGSKNTISGAVTAAFAGTVSAEKILIKNTDAQSITIEYKRAASDVNFTLFEDFALVKSGRDILITFDAPLEAASFKFTLLGEVESVYFYEFALLSRLLFLDKALTSFTPSGYRKGGYHYTADGTLIRWHEFSKKSGALVLENLSETTKQTLEYICDENIFLTFLFYGAYDLSQSGQYALTADFKAELNRLSGLWNVYLEITEK